MHVSLPGENPAPSCNCKAVGQWRGAEWPLNAPLGDELPADDPCARPPGPTADDQKPLVGGPPIHNADDPRYPMLVHTGEREECPLCSPPPLTVEPLNRMVRTRAEEVGAAWQPTVDERWYHEGSPVIEELAERLWAYESIPGKLPWDQLGTQGRVGPRRKAYEMLAIVEKHLNVFAPFRPTRPGFGYAAVPIPAGTRLGVYEVADD
jgi:hypothetical protein